MTTSESLPLGSESLLWGVIPYIWELILSLEKKALTFG